MSIAVALAGCSAPPPAPAPLPLFGVTKLDNLTVPGDWLTAQASGFTKCEEKPGDVSCERVPAGTFLGIPVRTADVWLNGADNVHRGGEQQPDRTAPAKPREQLTYSAITVHFAEDDKARVRTALTAAGWLPTLGRRGYERWVSPDHLAKLEHSGLVNGYWLTLEPFDPDAFGEPPIPAPQR